MPRAFLAAAIFALGTISAAHAAAPQGVSVAYGDLNLAAAAGQSALKLRLHDAAAKLCSPAIASTGGSEQSAREHMELYQACIGRLSERAMAKIQTGRD
jgi:UrcA family protein